MTLSLFCTFFIVVSTAAALSLDSKSRSYISAGSLTDAPVRPHVPHVTPNALFVGSPTHRPERGHEASTEARKFLSPVKGKAVVEGLSLMPRQKESAAAKLAKTVVGASESSVDGEAEMIGDESSSFSSPGQEGKGGTVSITASGTTVTKPELAAALASATGVSRVDVTKILDVLSTTVVEYIAAGRKVNLAKVGAFGAKKRSARTARNPRTSEVIQVEEKLAPTFGFSKTMKDLLQQHHQPSPAVVVAHQSGGKDAQSAEATSWFTKSSGSTAAAPVPAAAPSPPPTADTDGLGSKAGRLFWRS
eukprot:GHVS01082081.1.p1 GENE.GHVS01082081.1~~GHVS01082081.1.p1  ORF type:complete len:305 (+),score=61.92 GHVS01082081.1:122-1036(+)